jgi:hypothetical protein
MDFLTRRADVLLAVFLCCLVAINAGRLGEWGVEGFTLYFTQAIMQTTLFDFAWVLGILLCFLHQDARKHGITYWWILPTFPFMPTVGLLAYFIVRKRRLGQRPP